MDFEFFNSIGSYNWDLQPIDRSLDQIKINEYLSLIPDHYKPFINDLLKSTIYIKYSDFKESLYESFQKFKSAITTDNFYLLLPNSKITASHWLTAILWNELKLLNIIRIISTLDELSLNNINNIVIIDDIINSGSNIKCLLDLLIYDLSEKIKIPMSKLGIKFRFHILVPYISSGGKNVIMNFCKIHNIPCIIYNIHCLPYLTDLITIPESYDHRILQEFFGLESLDRVPINFDHDVTKDLNPYSTIYCGGIYPSSTHISCYGSLLLANPSQVKIKELEQLYTNYIAS
jgi:hypothetical protein